VSIGPRWLPAALVTAVGLVGYCSYRLYHGVSAGIPPSIPVSNLAVTCLAAAAGEPCETVLVALNPGRFRIQTTGPSSALSMTVGDPSILQEARWLLLRSAGTGRLLVGGDVIEVPGGERRILQLSSVSSDSSRLIFTPLSSGEPIVIEEFAFPTDLPAEAPWLRFYARYVAAATLALCAAFVIAAAFAPSSVPNPLGPVLMAAFCFFVCILELGTTFSPYWSRDIRSVYAAEVIQSGSTGNLTGGLFEGSRIVQGLGQTVPPGVVQWHRMPGYGWFCALAAAIIRSTDVIDIAIAVILMQALVYSISVGLFLAAALRVFSAWMAWLLAVLLVLAPKQVANTQVDAVIPAVTILGLATLLVYLAGTRPNRAPAFRTILLVNLGFALWFLMRNDVLPGWIAVTAVLSYPRWRHLALPVVLIVIIALPWALYKRQYTQRFDPLPTNTGEVFFLGLCEVPGAFPYECTDAGYFEWAARLGLADPTTRGASNMALGEVVRHWVTYPVHFAFMVWVKFRRCLDECAWTGFVTPLNRPYELFRRAGAFAVLLAVVIVSAAVNHERRRSFLLGWVLLLNMPLFFIVYASGGRFYGPAGISLLVAAVPLMFERGFYAQVARHPWRAALVVACLAAFVAGGARVEQWILTDDSLHYWAPLLDPEHSTLRFTLRQ
jgi:hypothetical protein